MRPETLSAYERISRQWPHDWEEIITGLAGPHHFHFEIMEAKAISEIALHEVKSIPEYERLRFPDVKLPAASFVLTSPDEKGNNGVFLVNECQDRVEAWDCTHGREPKGVAFLPGGTTCWEYGVSRRTDDVRLTQWLFTLAMAISLISEPRLIAFEAASGVRFSRQYRRSVSRATGKPATAWSTVRWKVTTARQAPRDAQGTEGAGRALHYRRAHWVRCDALHKGAEWLRFPATGEEGWFYWRKHSWPGHPAFGIKLQRHEPKLFRGEPERGKRPETGTSVPNAVKLEAISHAQRQAMVAAGFAPSATLN